MAVGLVMCPRPFVVTQKSSILQVSVTAQPLDIVKMSGNFQYEWAHEIEQIEIRDSGPRLNVTFRFVKNHHVKCPLYKNKSKRS